MDAAFERTYRRFFGDAFDGVYGGWLGDAVFDIGHARFVGDAEFEESEHPRGGDPKNPGRFSKSEAFVSPSVGESLSFAEAHAALGGKRQQTFARISRAVDRDLGLGRGTRETGVIGAWTDGAENSLMLTARADPDLVRAAAIIKGSIADQKAVLVFTPSPHGAHVMATFTQHGELADIHQKLLQEGLVNHTLEPVTGGARVHIYADSDATLETVDKFRQKEGIEVQLTAGDGAFIGTDKTDGSDAEQRADAQRIYDDALRALEGSPRLQGRDLRKLRDDHRDHWRDALEEAEAETAAVAEPRARAPARERVRAPARASPVVRPALAGSRGDPALISTRNPTAKGRTPQERAQIAALQQRYNRIDLDAMRADPALFHKNMQLLKDGYGYSNFRAGALDGKSDEEIARAAIDMAKSNLKFLYQHAPPDLIAKAHLWYEGAHNMAKAQADKYHLPLATTAAVFAALSPQKAWEQNVYFAEHVLDIYHNQKNTQWDAAMTATAKRIWKPKDHVHLQAIEGKTLGELDDPIDKAMWIRTYNQTHEDRTYYELSPSGERGAAITTAEGRPAKAAWLATAAIANAVKAIESGGDREIISDAMGDMHKVRSFYNNILDPHSANDDVTMDTHAVGAALLRPLSGADTAVMHSLHTNPQDETKKPPGWKGSGASNVTGIKGTYALWADAYRELAKELHIEPRVLQSATWEAKRELMNVSDQGKEEIEAAWTDYHDGKPCPAEAADAMLAGDAQPCTLAEVQNRVWQIAEEDRKQHADAQRGPAGAVDEEEEHSADPRELHRPQLGRGPPRAVGRGSRGDAAGRVAGDLDRSIGRFFGDAFDQAIDTFFANRALPDQNDGMLANRRRSSEKEEQYPVADAEFREEQHPRKASGRFARKGEGEAAGFKPNKVPPVYGREIERYGWKLGIEEDSGKQHWIDGKGGVFVIEPIAKPNDPVKWRLLPKNQNAIWGSGLSDLYQAMDKAGYQRGPPAGHKAIGDAARAVAEARGFNLDHLEISQEDKTFDLGGVDHYYAGAHFSSGPDKGKIIIYSKHVTPQTVKGVTAHEIEHEKFQTVWDQWEKDAQDYTASLAPAHARARLLDPEPEETLTPDEAKDYPVYAALQPFLTRSAQAELRRTDGVTDYSKDWWKAYEDGKATVLQATHETLAEMAYEEERERDPIGTEGREGAVPAAKIWKDFYKAVNTLYDQRASFTDADAKPPDLMAQIKRNVEPPQGEAAFEDAYRRLFAA